MIAQASDQISAGGIVAMLAGLLILSLAVLWMVFPVLVLTRLKDLYLVQAEALKAQREIARILDNWKAERVAAATRPPLQKL